VKVSYIEENSQNEWITASDHHQQCGVGQFQFADLHWNSAEQGRYASSLNHLYAADHGNVYYWRILQRISFRSVFNSAGFLHPTYEGKKNFFIRNRNRTWNPYRCPVGTKAGRDLAGFYPSDKFFHIFNKSEPFQNCPTDAGHQCNGCNSVLACLWLYQYTDCLCGARSLFIAFALCHLVCGAG